jgi:hypothetical protein
MVHKHEGKKLAMAYRIYINFPYGALKDKWFPMLEQRKFLDDIEGDEWILNKNPMLAKIGMRSKIVYEPAEATEMLERKMFRKLGWEKQSMKRGLLESMLVFY